MTSFALGIWAWEKTGSAQALALVGVFTYAPLIIVTPMVGVLVDRWNRKLVMMLSDLGAVLATVTVFLLFISGRLEVWHIYATTAFASTFQAFQWPAYSATVTLMVPKKHYSRASGMISMVESASNIIGPVLAGSLIGLIGLRGILIIDILTFFVAIFTLLIVVIPQPVVEKAKTNVQDFLKDMTFGFKFIFQRRGLLGLQLVFFFANFMTVIGWAVLSPMVLARTGDAQGVGFCAVFFCGRGIGRRCIPDDLGRPQADGRRDPAGVDSEWYPGPFPDGYHRSALDLDGVRLFAGFLYADHQRVQSGDLAKESPAGSTGTGLCCAPIYRTNHYSHFNGYVRLVGRYRVRTRFSIR